MKAVGVSNYSEKRLRAAYEQLKKRGIPLASNQVNYSLIYRAPEKNGVKKACDELGITLIAYSPLAQVNGTSMSVKVNPKPKNSSVKLSIKSFKVPELYIKVPETTTVGSLKRTVIETVTAILGGSLRVGVVLRGKKVRDDSRTLQQAGISYGGNLDSLGFILEPNFMEVNEPSKDCPPLLKCEAEQKSLG